MGSSTVFLVLPNCYLLLPGRQKFGSIVAIFTAILLFGFKGNGVIFVVCVTFLPCGHIGIGSSEVFGKFISELTGGLGIALIIISAPSLIDLEYSACGRLRIDFAIVPRTHTFFKETDDGAVFLDRKPYGSAGIAERTGICTPYEG